MKVGSDPTFRRSGSVSIFLALVLLLLPALASAHYRGTSYSDWTLDAEGATVRARVSQLELTRLQLDPASTPDYAAQVGERLRQDVQLWSASGRCEAGPATTTPTDHGWVAAQWTLRCADLRELSIRSNLFLAVAPSHLHFARVQAATGDSFERVLTYTAPSFAIAPAASSATAPDRGSSFLRYVKLGIEHILSGWDHLAFVLALILLATKVREVALLATGFTIAHSLTLAAAVLGWVDVQPPAIEALIGFSIAIVAAENLWLRSGRERWMPAVFVIALLCVAATGAHYGSSVVGIPAIVLLGLALFTASYFLLVAQLSSASGARDAVTLRAAVAFIFGLVHGFGFAGALTPMHLPQEHLVAGLLGFNAGVEIGQLAVIATVGPLLKLLSRAPHARLWAGDVASACICGLGVFWFVTRVFGGMS